ncbi:ankyrin repeat domain-containing protein [Rickettsia endosymbiont of Halotydeus destructor]|uniref:ankyrin repeat domain-containing protein n=1 Tax=Rickettsia endosymbiont of Halotydeus destructor TaxID=2996754 RepID=UPI003BB1C772
MWLLEWLEQLFEAKAKIQINRVLELPSLHQAVLNNNISEVRLCLHHKANVNEQDIINGSTALHYAIKNGNVEIISCLLKCQGINLTIKNKQDYTPLDLLQKIPPINLESSGSIFNDYNKIQNIGEIKIIDDE